MVKATNHKMFMDWATQAGKPTNKSSGMHYHNNVMIESNVCVSPLAIRAANSIIINDTIYVRGQVVHTRREHYLLNLRNVWHRVVMNTAERSWTVVGQSGRVD